MTNQLDNASMTIFILSLGLIFIFFGIIVNHIKQDKDRDNRKIFREREAIYRELLKKKNN